MDIGRYNCSDLTRGIESRTQNSGTMPERRRASKGVRFMEGYHASALTLWSLLTRSGIGHWHCVRGVKMEQLGCLGRQARVFTALPWMNQGETFP